LLRKAFKLIDGLRINRNASAHLMATYGPFAASERLLMEAAKRGGDRQELHEVLREHALAAWDSMQAGQGNPLIDGLAQDETMLKLMSEADIRACMKSDDYVGDAPERARGLVNQIRSLIGGE